MNRRLGRNIMESQQFIIFIDFFTGDLSGNNFTKQTVTHEEIIPLPVKIIKN
jgi:hypothetical protein